MPDDSPQPPSPGSEDAKSPDTRMIDVRGMIRQASTRVRVDQLVKRGTKYLSLLSKEKIDELINQAVKTIVDKYRAVAAGFQEVPAETLQAESKQEFSELLTQYQATTKAKGQLEATKEALDKELDDLRKDLERQKGLADGKLIEEAEHALVIGFKEFERELDRIVVKTFEKRKLILENQNDPQAIAELDQIKAILRKIIAELVAKERERYLVAGGSEKDREIAMLERRMEKLYEHISAMEIALRTISNSKLYSNQQIQNLLRQLGLVEEDRNYEKKREMLKVLLQYNLDLRKKFKEVEAPQSVDSPATV